MTQQFYPYGDEGLTLDELATLPECRVDRERLAHRLDKGWPVERAVRTPVRKMNRLLKKNYVLRPGRQFPDKCNHGFESVNKNAQCCRICGEAKIK